jgi:hypothetical protein
VEHIKQRLHDPDISVRIQASVSLVQCGDVAGGCTALLDMLHSARDEESRVSILRAFEPVFGVGQSNPGPTVIKAVEVVILCLKDKSPAVRHAACQGLGGVSDPKALEDMADLLADSIAEVRASAARSLRLAVPVSLPFVLARLPNASYPEDVLNALPAGNPLCVVPLRSFARNELSRLQVWRETLRNISKTGPTARFLSAILETRAARSTKNLVKVIGLLGNDRAMELVAQAFKTTDPESHAIALEALDTLGDRQIVKDLLTLIEEALSPDGYKADAAPFIRQLLATENGWMQALVVRAAEELGLASLIYHDSITNKDQFTNETGGVSLRQTGGALWTPYRPFPWLNVLSCCERFLYFRIYQPMTWCR